MRTKKKLSVKYEPSEILDSIVFSNYEIKCLKHGNTKNILYSFPSKAHNWENCWTLDLQTAKNGILKYQQQVLKKDSKKKD